jgi:hypothetical protein
LSLLCCSVTPELLVLDPLTAPVYILTLPASTCNYHELVIAIQSDRKTHPHRSLAMDATDE